MPTSHMRRFVLVVISLAGHFFISGASGQDLLEEVRAGNKSALESIRTLYCRVTVANLVSPAGQSGNTTTDFWRSGDSWRARFVGGRFIDLVGNDFSTRAIRTLPNSRGGEETIFSILRANPNQWRGPFDPYACGLLTLNYPDTLEGFLLREHKLGPITRQQYQGRECVVLKLSIPFTDKSVPAKAARRK